MRVAELRAVLEHMPDDAVVILSGGTGARHVEQVRRNTRNSTPGRWAADSEAMQVLNARPDVILNGDRLWMLSEPEFEIDGPVRRKTELDAKLDGLVFTPAPSMEQWP